MADGRRLRTAAAAMAARRRPLGDGRSATAARRRPRARLRTAARGRWGVHMVVVCVLAARPAVEGLVHNEHAETVAGVEERWADLLLRWLGASCIGHRRRLDGLGLAVSAIADGTATVRV